LFVEAVVAKNIKVYEMDFDDYTPIFDEVEEASL